jgi:endonuclease/exonuclease/phosphatase (EEP) superfamily protein YafD
MELPEFDAVEDRAERRRALVKGLAWFVVAPLLPPFQPIRLDHLLVSREVEMLSVAEGEGRGSDHRPIVAEFALRPERARAR